MRASPSSYFFYVAPSKRERGGAVRFSPKAELSLWQGISLQTSHPAEDVPTTVPHSGRESSRRAAYAQSNGGSNGRRLLIALWQFATQGVVPEGAVMKPTY